MCDLLCLASFTQCYVWKICPCRCICSQWSLGFCMNRPIYLLLMGTWVIPSLGLLHIVLITFYFVILVNQLHIFVGPILRSERTASQGIHMFSISRYCQRVFQKKGLYHFAFPPAAYESSSSLMFSPTLGQYHVF